MEERMEKDLRMCDTLTVNANEKKKLATKLSISTHGGLMNINVTTNECAQMEPIMVPIM